MKKKLAFTLIELLAVIIVLVIIALIATPIIFNIIENAKLKSLENSCYGVIEAVKTKYSESLLNSEDGKITLSGNVEDLNLSGEHPYWGTWKIDNTSDSIDRGIKIQNVKFKSMKNYSCSNISEDGTITKVNCYKDGIDEVIPTITANETSVTFHEGTNQKIKKLFTTTFGVTGGEVVCDVENVNLLTAGDYMIKCVATGTNGKIAEANITLSVILALDTSGANTPVLYDNMIPIVYVGNKWIYSNGTQENWYNYTNKQWANAVILNSGTTKEVGDEIKETDIALWYVWIPRYKYTIFNGNNGSAAEQLINVTFESETSTTGTTKCVNNIDGTETCSDNTFGSVTNGKSTYTHPAFTFGNTDLKGFWVGKFEISGSTSVITIKPNVSSLRNETLSSFFTAIQNIKTTYGITNADSHMMKNMEWGSIAYLKQSKYGLGLTEIGVNNRMNYITGCGTKAGSGFSGVCNTYDTTGMIASTTGNIYGVYDMSGGSWEYVMGNSQSEDNSFNVGGSGFTSALDSKYYDSYTYGTSDVSYASGKLGDATKETLSTFGNLHGGWYGDWSFFLSSGYPWFIRGGDCYSNTLSIGIFYFHRYSGEKSGGYSTRAVLTLP